MGDRYPDGGMMYGITPMAMTEPEQSNPPATMESAQVTAKHEIRERHGGLPLKLTDSSITNNNYVFKYRQIIHNFPMFNNGDTEGIDARDREGQYILPVLGGVRRMQSRHRPSRP